MRGNSDGSGTQAGAGPYVGVGEGGRVVSTGAAGAAREGTGA